MKAGGSIVLGLVIGVAVIVAWAYATISLSGSFSSVAGGIPYGILAYGVPLGYFVAAIVLATRPQVARVGAGLLIAVGVVPLLAAGLCFGLLAAQSG